MSSLEILGGLERRLNISISQPQFKAEVDARLNKVGRTAKLHGFRPGKIPFKVLEQHYGAQVQQEVLEMSVQRSFVEATREHDLKVAGMPQIEIKSPNFSGAEIEFSATFEVYPTVVVGDVSAEKIERVSFEMSDADVADTVLTLRKQRAVFEVAARAAENGDQVRMDFNGTLAGVPFEGGSAENFELVLGAGRMLPDFEKATLGLSAGETRSFEMTFPADYHGKDVAGKEVTFVITVHEVKAPRLPELDAEFAKTLGVADGDLTKLTAEIRANLNREAQRRVKVKNKDSAMEVLLKVGQLDAPKALVHDEAQNLMQQTIQDLAGRGIKIPQGMQLPLDAFEERAEKRVKLGLILAELVKLHQLQPKAEQVKALIQEYAESYEHPEEVIRWYAAEASRLQEVENLVLEDNVVAWVMAAAKVSDQSIALKELMGNEQNGE
jgi:trigger factor